jgi:hypothetical protein
MLVDLAYVLKHELRGVGYRKPEAVGVLLVPPADKAAPRSGPVANTFAALTEIYHYTAGAARYVLSLTTAGRAEMLQRLRKPADHEITDFTRFYVVLAFLSHLPEVAERHAVLRRRLEFLEEPASFFYDNERPLRAEEIVDPYRRGMLLTARATSRAERTWLRETLGEKPPAFDTTVTDSDPHAPAAPAS